MRVPVPIALAICVLLIAVAMRRSGPASPPTGSASADIQQTARAPGSAPGRLSVCGNALCLGEQRFLWNGVTAFGLVDLVADGHEREARAFVAWARSLGLNVLRVLAMLPNGGWLDLSPDEGRRALPQVFAIAREHGMYVQVVALANTNEQSGRFRPEAFLRQQVREVGRLCAAAGNCVLEIANEPYHGSQARLEDPSLMQRLQQEAPKELPVAWGAAARDDSPIMTGGTFVVAHVGRSGDRWTRIERMRSLAALSASTGKFVVDNEPIGAAEAPEPQRRDSTPETFFAQGVVSRLIEVGSTFHCQDCLRARVPGPIQQRCAEAFVEGRRIVPENVRLTPADSEVASVRVRVPQAGGGEARVFTATAGSRAWVLVLGGSTPALRWQHGWRPERRVAGRPEVEMWSAVR